MKKFIEICKDDDKPNPKFRRDHRMVSNGTDKCYLFGGTDQEWKIKFDDLWCLELKPKYKWYKINVKNSIARACHGMIFHNNKIYTFCGSGSKDTLNDINYIDLNDKEFIWKNIKMDNIPKVYGFAYDLYKDNILIFGGYYRQNNNNVYKINLTKNKCDQIVIIFNNINLIPRRYVQSSVIKDKFYIYGGYTDKGIVKDNHIYYIDLKTNIMYSIN